MADKKYQVFISSTYSDLKEERRKILDTLLMADCIPSGMEAFVATDNEQFEVIKKVIDLCDYYVLIIGKRYGSVSPITGKSYTEMEYDYARSKDIPILVFAIDTNVVLDESKVETDAEKIKLLESFRLKALNSRLASIWRTPEDLTTSLAVSIMKAKYDIPRAGWQRATDYDEASLRREISSLAIDNEKLLKKFNDAQATISSLTEQSNLAFENYKIKIKYHWKTGDRYMGSIEHQGEKSVDLQDIFSVIALEMLETPIHEHTIESILKQELIGSDFTYYFDDHQLVKTILLQFESLGLITARYYSDPPRVFWELTEKGKKIRNDSLLLRNLN